MTYITADAMLTAGRFGQAWKAVDGTIRATVRFDGAPSIVFDSPQDARALAAACIEAAEAMEWEDRPSQRGAGGVHPPAMP